MLMILFFMQEEVHHTSGNPYPCLASRSVSTSRPMHISSVCEPNATWQAGVLMSSLVMVRVLDLMRCAGMFMHATCMRSMKELWE